MFDIFKNFLWDVLEDALSSLFETLQAFISNLMIISLQLEKVGELWSVESPVTLTAIESAYKFTYMTMCGIMALAFLYKGFKVYILWRDGDADVSPQSMLMGAGEAIITAVAFPYLYNILCDFVLYLADGVIERFAISTEAEWEALLENSDALILAILLIVFLILMVIVICRLLCRGVELLFLRLGFPLVCLGLINSDSGIFKQYAGLFFRQAALSVIQMICLMMGLFCAVGSHQITSAILAIAFMLCALSAPKIMAQLLPASGGSGGGKAMMAAQIARLVIMKG